MMRWLMMIGVVLSMSLPSWAMFMQPQPMPVDRIAANLEAYVKTHPDDPQGYYMLGRLHYLAVVFKSTYVGVYPLRGSASERLTTVPTQQFQSWVIPRHNEEKGIEPLGREAIGQHDAMARKYLEQAIELDPKRGLYYLTLGSLLEQGGQLLAAATDENEPQADTQRLREAKTAYLRAFELAFPEESQRRGRPVEGLPGFVSYEAGQGYLRVSKQLADETDAATEQRVAEGVTSLEAKPRLAVTPIVFSLEAGRTLEQLIDHDARVTFDLAGDGGGRQWPWVRPGTGLLVWDPAGTGDITSARQLFGSVTWWLFWDTGYAAMASLDDNRDGWLRGDELRGLAVWFDHNADGVSTPSEVHALADLGIAGLRTAWDKRIGHSYQATAGLELNTGETRPTWDWVAEDL